MTVVHLDTVISGMLVLAILGGLTYYHFWKLYPSLPIRSFSDPAHCAEILACASFEGIHNRVGKLESRAFPNQRLVEAFGINNAFTTSDNKMARAFRTEAAKRIEIDDTQWQRIAKLAQQLVREGITTSGTDQMSANLDLLVQDIALRLALHILFDLEPLDLDKSGISTLAQAINDCWIYSKSSDRHSMYIAKEKMNSALHMLFPASQLVSESQHNPLNFILPAYETLWRAVLLCYIEVSFRQNRQAETLKWRETLTDFLVDPTQAAYEQPSSANLGMASVSVCHIVNEGLRLYPPTRRIHRRYDLENSQRQEVLAADIETMQRDPRIWEDPLTFNPSRWLHINDEARHAFMPFGNRPFLCPAQKAFGPRMIGILVAALTAHLDPEFLRLSYRKSGSGEHEARNLGDREVINTDRNAYQSWRIQTK